MVHYTNAREIIYIYVYILKKKIEIDNIEESHNLPVSIASRKCRTNKRKEERERETCGRGSRGEKEEEGWRNADIYERARANIGLYSR